LLSRLGLASCLFGHPRCFRRHDWYRSVPSSALLIVFSGQSACGHQQRRSAKYRPIHIRFHNWSPFQVDFGVLLAAITCARIIQARNRSSETLRNLQESHRFRTFRTSLLTSVVSRAEMPDLASMPVPRRNDERDDRLESWKEIAPTWTRSPHRSRLGEKRRPADPSHQHAGGFGYASTRIDTAGEPQSLVESSAPVEQPFPTSQISLPIWRLPRRLILIAFLGFVFGIRSPASAARPVLSVVLPFSTESTKDQDYFSAGYQEIIDRSVACKSAGSRSNFRLVSGKANDIRQIGSIELNTVWKAASARMATASYHAN